MGMILLLIGFAGIALLFLAQSYRATRMSLSRIKAFSDNLVENMPIGLVAIDNHRKVTSLNHVAGFILSLSAAEVIGVKCHAGGSGGIIEVAGKSRYGKRCCGKRSRLYCPERKGYSP